MSLKKTAVALVLLLGILAPSQEPAQAKKNLEGLLPIGADGKPLNLDFETGTLKDWTSEGKAFLGQPIKGDTVYPRRSDNKSQHQGQFWIGGYERFGDKPQGTLTSAAFKITHPWASFLVGGGPWPQTCVELVLKEGRGARDEGRGEKVFFRASGLEEENLRRVVVDLKPYLGNTMFIRLVDKHSGHWGHINFDDFRFHDQKPNFPPRPGTAGPDVYKFAGLPPQKAAQVMTVPEGFEVKLFAGEPDVQQPIALCLDDRGRVWVAEGYTYPRRHPHPGPLLPEKDKAKGDRILIFEDTDGDGKFDKRTVFLEGLNLVSGLEVGFGGVWIGAAPYLLFVPMKEVARSGDRATTTSGDRATTTVPAGPPRILLDGWGWQDTHETLNSFIWGPDGWLYGCHGVFTHSKVGKPGALEKDRIPINAGVWRYHPTRHVFEVFAHGTSNPWGLDFNDYGQAFVEACVIPHAFHIIQGGRYHRQAGSHFNPHTYADLKTIADHLHWQGANPWAGNNRSDSAGGGHAHCGTMIYLGGSWPEKYRGQMFMGNIHGRRINMDILKEKGSGYVASHGPDFLLANDAYARFINLRYGPDGNVYLIDWYDKQACHTGDVKIWDRSNGRIYKICWRGTKPVQVDLQKKTDRELAELQLHENDWYVRHARRILQERYQGRARKERLKEDYVARKLFKMSRQEKDDRHRLRAMWALSVVDGWGRELTQAFLDDPSPYVRAWAIQLDKEESGLGGTIRPVPKAKPPTKLEEALDQQFQREHEKKLAEMARKDPSPIVRLYLASACQRMPLEKRWEILEGLLSHAEDAGDQNLPLMYWYAAEPLGGQDPVRALELASRSKIPQVLAFMVRRIGSAGTPEAIALLVGALAKTDDAAVQLTFLQGINLALKGRRQVDMPAAWPKAFTKLAASASADVRSQAGALAVTFGDPGALAEMRNLLANAKADFAARQNALASLLGAKDKNLPPLLQKLLAEPALRGPALRGLAAYDDPTTPKAILAIYVALPSAEKRDALNTLASRAGYAKVLLDAVGGKKIVAADLSADILRQLRNLHNKDINSRITEVWGIVRDTPADRAKLLAEYKALLAKPAKTPPDLPLGRALYVKNCAQCHSLFAAGGKIGPDITGANRADLHYLLENIIDPSALIPKEYAATIIEMKDGRVITGIVKSDNGAAFTVQTANDILILPRKEIESLKPTATSMMPDDALKQLKENEVRALIAYLQNPNQVPLLATADNVKDFFNGKDLTGWDGDAKLWKVDNGEIVGKSPGLKKNEFLRSHMLAGDFRLKLNVKLAPKGGNSGVRFRSEALPDSDIKGMQAGLGRFWWGKLSDEHGRGLFYPPGLPEGKTFSFDDFVKPGDWNDYEIVAAGPRIRTYINGKLCMDYEDKTGPPRGIFALQLHSGGPMEVRFREIKLEVPWQRP